jgi:hypothetical protein
MEPSPVKWLVCVTSFFLHLLFIILICPVRKTCLFVFYLFNHLHYGFGWFFWCWGWKPDLELARQVLYLSVPPRPPIWICGYFTLWVKIQRCYFVGQIVPAKLGMVVTLGYWF